MGLFFFLRLFFFFFLFYFLPHQDNLTKLKLLSQKNYLDQAQWFLNAYWACKEINYESHPDERERVWKYYNSIITMGAFLVFKRMNCFFWTDLSTINLLIYIYILSQSYID